MMKTTLAVLKVLRVLHKRDGGTLGALASRFLAEALARRGKRSPEPLRWTARPMGASVDPADNEAVYAILDQADRAADS